MIQQHRSQKSILQNVQNASDSLGVFAPLEKVTKELPPGIREPSILSPGKLPWNIAPNRIYQYFPRIRK